MELTRRQLLAIGGAAGAGVVIPAWLRSTIANSGPEFFPARNESLAYRKNLESFVPSVCQECTGGCMLKVRVIDGDAVGVSGHPTHPVTRGAVCPKGPASLQALYHPDRIPQPMLRVGQRGEGQWKFITWDEAIKKVAHQLQDLRHREKPHTVTVLDGSRAGLTRTLLERFAAAYGTPNYVHFNWTMGEYPVDAFRAMQDTEELAYDLTNARYVLSFGMDWLQCFPSPIEASRSYGLIRQGREGQRGRIVQIESRLSLTGGKADEWIPVNPETEGLLALGVAHVILKENRFDRGFTSSRTTGFDEWSRIVAQEYPPDRVEKATGVPQETIIRVAREFASNRPALALSERVSFFNQLAVHALNALAGNIGLPGGVLAANTPEAGTLPSFDPDPVARRGGGRPRVDGAGTTFTLASDAPQQLPENLLAKKPYPVNTLVVSNCNPLFASPNPKRWKDALAEVPSIVSFSPFMDETAAYADLIVPDHTPLESWQDAPSVTLGGERVVGMAKPAVIPVCRTRQAADVLLKVSHLLGGSVGAAFPWANFDTLLKECAQQAHASGHAKPLMLDPAEEPSDEALSIEDFWEVVTAGGGWTLPAEPQRQQTRFNFRPDFVRSPIVNQKANIADSFPLRLCLFNPLAFSHADGAHLPYLNSIAGPQLDERWETWAGFNPETARSHGIANGDEVWVESPAGRVRAKARWYQGAMPGLVNMPCGLGHAAHGRWAKGVGSNPMELVEKLLDPVTGQPDWQSQRVRVYRV